MRFLDRIPEVAATLHATPPRHVSTALFPGCTAVVILIKALLALIALYSFHLAIIGPIYSLVVALICSFAALCAQCRGLGRCAAAMAGLWSECCSRHAVSHCVYSMCNWSVPLTTKPGQDVLAA